jgi:hypothetical protein
MKPFPLDPLLPREEHCPRHLGLCLAGAAFGVTVIYSAFMFGLGWLVGYTDFLDTQRTRGIISRHTTNTKKPTACA